MGYRQEPEVLSTCPRAPSWGETKPDLAKAKLLSLSLARLVLHSDLSCLFLDAFCQQRTKCPSAVCQACWQVLRFQEANQHGTVLPPRYSVHQISKLPTTKEHRDGRTRSPGRRGAAHGTSPQREALREWLLRGELCLL